MKSGCRDKSLGKNIFDTFCSPSTMRSSSKCVAFFFFSKNHQNKESVGKSGMKLIWDGKS